jgi:hypothetical protein
MIVRHEMLHALLQRGTHSPEYFHRRCFGVVDCKTSCAADTLATFQAPTAELRAIDASCSRASEGSP